MQSLLERRFAAYFVAPSEDGVQASKKELKKFTAEHAEIAEVSQINLGYLGVLCGLCDLCG